MWAIQSQDTAHTRHISFDSSLMHQLFQWYSPDPTDYYHRGKSLTNLDWEICCVLFPRFSVHRKLHHIDQKTILRPSITVTGCMARKNRPFEHNQYHTLGVRQRGTQVEACWNDQRLTASVTSFPSSRPVWEILEGIYRSRDKKVTSMI